MTTYAADIKQVRKVRTACALCQNFCGVLASIVDDQVVQLEGDPENPRNMGHLCAKGLSGHLSLYLPERIKRPMERTNPQKGLGVDPMWKEIGWEDAIQKIAGKIRGLIDSPGGPKGKIIWSTFDYWATPRTKSVESAFFTVLGALFMPLSADCFCGNAVHPPSYLNVGAFEITPDAEYAKYLLLIGAQAGSMVNYDTMRAARNIAEKRPGEVKVTVVDPVCSHAASRAEEWVPIRPGTDAAFILGLVNVLINENRLYDSKFLKEKTNAPYLVGEDGLYVRDSTTAKPLVWDSIANKPRAFDSETPDAALEGTYHIDGKAAKPAFQLLKNHVEKYTPKYVSEITTVPSETIRRVALELGEAAEIGSTIMIDGIELPHRPVAVVWYRGLSAHRHSFLAGLSALLLPTLLGTIQVPGGIKGDHPISERTSEDGLLSADALAQAKGAPYPPRPVVRPSRIDLYELFPVAVYSNAMIFPMLLEPGKFGFKADELVKPEILINYRNNPVRNISPEYVSAAFKKIPFIVCFDTEPNETSNLADIVLPDLHYLERTSEGMSMGVNEPGYWYAPKQVMKPNFDPPYNTIVSIAPILLDIAEKAGFLSGMYDALNTMWGTRGTPYEIDPTGRYSHNELIDRRLKSWLGPNNGLDWLMRDEGGLLVWGATPQERYKGPFRKARVHVYYEFMIGAGKEVERVTKEMPLAWDYSDYQALPDWKPCISFLNRSDEYDLFVVNSKVPTQSHGLSRSNTILRQIGDYHRQDYALMNTETASRKGLKDGDEIYIEAVSGAKIRARLRLTERVHPEVIATNQHRLAKGFDYNDLVALNPETVDFVSCAVDSCLLARAYKA